LSLWSWAHPERRKGDELKKEKRISCADTGNEKEEKEGKLAKKPFSSTGEVHLSSEATRPAQKNRRTLL